ncbi:MAG: ferrochelatase [Planctomycetaceae bacterium]|nr:ferrochelatase [Planctomycetaceae bacterium]
MSDAFLLVSYGSPECRDDVLPFLNRLFHGRRVSSAVAEKAAAQYDELALKTGQYSPLSRQCRYLIEKLRQRNTLRIPIFWGNLFWHPLLTDTLAEMHRQGIQRATAFITSPFESDFIRKRYIDAIENTQNKIEIRLLPAFGNHPLYYRAVADRILEAAALLALDLDDSLEKAGTRILFTAHSLPLSDQGTEQYVSQLNKAASELLPAGLRDLPWELVFQSRGGKPSDPWLEPDICVRVRQLAEERDRTGNPLSLLIVPMGFLLENKETAYDLDLQTLPLCDKLNIPVVRVPTAGSSPPILEMIETL